MIDAEFGTALAGMIDREISLMRANPRKQQTPIVQQPEGAAIRAMEASALEAAKRDNAAFEAAKKKFARR